MDIALNPAARWNEPSAWFLRRPATPARRDTTHGQAAPECQLAAGSTLRVASPLGSEVVCLNGTLWITHDGEADDHIVEPGQPYTAGHASTMLVHAMGDACCLVMAARG